MEVLSEDEWQAREQEHQARVRRWVEPRLARASRSQKHPVEDFLFQYYSNRPAKLLRWHPGIEVSLQGETARRFLGQRDYREGFEGITVGVLRLSAQRMAFVGWLREMLKRIAGRRGLFGCLGLHEWAMVYRADSIRHGNWPLRATSGQISKLVESIGPRCTHYDAFRFFTPAARPLNRWQPTRSTISALEQPACLHTNMDLYKWAFKLAPFTPSELVADCFELARDIRAVDMRASPYDFSALGYLPIPIETPGERAEYERLQHRIALAAIPLRARIASVCDRIIEKAACLHGNNSKSVR
jgi:hypothetical protein